MNGFDVFAKQTPCGEIHRKIIVSVHNRLYIKSDNTVTFPDCHVFVTKIASNRAVDSFCFILLLRRRRASSLEPKATDATSFENPA